MQVHPELLATLILGQRKIFAFYYFIFTERCTDLPHVRQLDEDLTRAKTLLQLFEMRGKFKQMGDTGLSRAKQRVDDVVARYAKVDLEEREKVARARYLGV